MPAEYDPTLYLDVTFHLTDKAEFWRALAREAALYDEDATEEGYSQAQAFLLVFHRDGLETICRLMEEHGTHLGWCINNDWSKLAEMGQDKVRRRRSDRRVAIDDQRGVT